MAYTSVGKGLENEPKIFFYKELAPTKAPEDIDSKQLSSTSFNVTWKPLTLFEARGFPEYRVVATPKDTNSRRKRQKSDPSTGIQVMMTEGSFVVFTDLRQNTDYSVVVGVRTGNGTEFLEALPIDGTKYICVSVYHN